MRHDRGTDINDYIDRVKTVPKQNEHFDFSAPEMPDFMLKEIQSILSDETPVAEKGAKEKEAPKASEATTETPTAPTGKKLQIMASGRVTVTDIIGKYSLSIINGESAELYKLTPDEKEVLIEAQTELMIEENTTLSARRVRNELIAIIYLPKAIRGIYNRFQQLYMWFATRKERKAKKVAGKAHKQQSTELDRNQAEQLEIIDQIRQEKEENTALLRELNKANIAIQKEIDNKKATKPKPASKKAAPKAEVVKALTLDELQAKKAANLCLWPPCKEHTEGSFCTPSHRSKYVGSCQRKTDPFIKLSVLKK